CDVANFNTKFLVEQFVDPSTYCTDIGLSFCDYIVRTATCNAATGISPGDYVFDITVCCGCDKEGG
ncbi:MAG: hypothetical protein ACXABY_37250, partial [Candidatus Thorarchaeota archaeon]